MLLPGELLPLHIFEPRYRELVTRSLAGPEPFCVLLEDEAGTREVGCLARDLTVLERLADGRLNVVVSGGEPVRLGPARRRGPLLPDEPRRRCSKTTTRNSTRTRIEAALAAYNALLSEIGREDAGAPFGPVPGSAYALGARIDVGVQVGQALLESRSERARLLLITEALEQGRHSLRLSAERERRAVRNGKVDPAN